MNGLMLHVGAAAVDFDQLRAVNTPEATATHVPLPHHHLVEMVRYALGFYDHEIVEEHHALMPDGQRYFGLMSLKSPYGDYIDTLGLRNSHDKSFPVGLAYGARVFVCDNTSFIGDQVIKRKHTVNAKRDLPGLVSSVIEPLRLRREEQHACFERYQQAEIADELADHAIMRMYREGVINLTRIADVNSEWHTPSHDWGSKTAWRLFNAATFALKGRVAENPSVTADLHKVIDGVCERVH
jgi:hypothetical protein